VSGDESGFQVEGSAAIHYESTVGLFMAPFVATMVEATVREGHRVLDVACGTGFATRSAARAAGASGDVVGSDLNPGMLATARTVPWDGPAISWREASALDLPFDDETFDAVLCQQGLQFFPDPPAGIREMVRVLRTGGRLTVTVWAPLERNPFFAAEVDMLVECCDIERDAWSDAFPSGEREIAAWFADAGRPDVAIDLIEAHVDLPPATEYVPRHLRALPWPNSFFDLTASARQAAIADLEEELGAYSVNGGLRVPFRSFQVEVEC
jgi:SAM-dependent methyltransferase